MVSNGFLGLVVYAADAGSIPIATFGGLDNSQNGNVQWMRLLFDYGFVVEAVEHVLERGAESALEERRDDDGDDSPDDKGMPLPAPEKFGGVPGVKLDGVDESFALQRETGSVKEEDAEADKDREEQELQRVHDMVAELRGNDVQAEDGREREGKHSGGTEQRVDADDDANGDGPRQLMGRSSDSQQLQQRVDQPPPEEIG